MWTGSNCFCVPSSAGWAGTGQFSDPTLEAKMMTARMGRKQIDIKNNIFTCLSMGRGQLQGELPS